MEITYVNQKEFTFKRLVNIQDAFDPGAHNDNWRSREFVQICRNIHCYLSTPLDTISG